MKALSRMSRDIRSIYGVLVEHQRTSGNGYEPLAQMNQQLQSENQQLRSENQQLRLGADSHKKQAAVDRRALSMAANRIAFQDRKIDELSNRVKLLEKTDKVQGEAPLHCKATPDPQTPKAEKRPRSDDDEQGISQDAEVDGRAKRRSIWPGKCLKEAGSTASIRE